MRESEVSKHLGVGVRIIYACAVVAEGVFKTYFGCVPSDLDLKVVSVLGIDGKPFNAVVMTFVEPWPVNLPHYKMELYCDQSRDWKDVLLTPDWNLRKGQAKDRFTLACKHLEEKTDKSLHMKALPDMTTLAHVDQQAKKLQKAREKAEEDDNDDFADVKLMPATIISASNRNEDDDDSDDDGRPVAASERRQEPSLPARLLNHVDLLPLRGLQRHLHIIHLFPRHRTLPGKARSPCRQGRMMAPCPARLPVVDRCWAWMKLMTTAQFRTFK